MVPEMENDDFDVGPSTSKGKKRNTVYTPEWRKKHPEYENMPSSNEEVDKKKVMETLADLSPLDIFFMFFDEELLNKIKKFSEKYAKDNNRHDFFLTITDLKRFIGILVFSGYHTLPQLEMYWSRDEDKGVALVKNCMSRNKFRNIKRNLHLCDNAELDKNDKFAKLRPLFDAINERNLQFGLFSHNLSIDEEMVPYFGRHSAKMFIKGKPVRFGFKLWCLCSEDGYLFQFMPYGGARKEKSEMGLGADVVVSLLKVIENPSSHRVFFDNFFSSYKLFSFLGERHIYATGTIRDNRISDCKLESTNTIKKRERGCFDYRFDSKSKSCVVRWNDNSVVTLITNNISINPVQPVKRYDRKLKKEINIPQPLVIKEYNKYMGGVDLHDNGIANYRIRVRGKKWWWPLFINSVDSVIVNVWKLYKMTHPKITQLEVRSYLVMALMKTEEITKNANNKSEINRVSNQGRGRPTGTELPDEIRRDRVGHVISRHPEKARKRCRQCKSQTVFMCEKCKVHLHSICFVSFHNI